VRAVKGAVKERAKLTVTEKKPTRKKRPSIGDDSVRYAIWRPRGGWAFKHSVELLESLVSLGHLMALAT